MAEPTPAWAEEAIGRCAIVAFDGSVWRGTRDRYAPEDPAGSLRTPGRYNRAGESVLYLSREKATAYSELMRRVGDVLDELEVRITTDPDRVKAQETIAYLQQLRRDNGVHELHLVVPRLLIGDPDRLGCARADLLQDPVADAIGRSSYPFTWLLSDAARRRGVDAIQVPAAGDEGWNINVFDVRFPGDPRITRTGKPPDRPFRR